ncbi:hypothetical protein A3J90_03965 [candidate division WOR-1 bacterium RIFOXYC2_FULL_37_10]|uniref:Uncharacterized protein n=1 Tax=candidate division WOR-1 bacterium RIFOXYB2_FULL_37_13 TaxID=1802579 RepID=A0A1F4SJH8_UNCSA|nr:MAG: hypothetical protein A2310_05710 [candidate division WOR-1 bacterium RIFOXYB2_FULL_37_13]OGC32926.1 MAG: hypothetical protein A3J90_03965 [candidate division WOR-1 bacterium RIFOXYC2_FULL_37_10]
MIVSLFFVLIGGTFVVLSFNGQGADIFSFRLTGATFFFFGILGLIFHNYIMGLLKGLPKPYEPSLKTASDRMASMASFLKEQNRMNKLSASGQPVKVKILGVRDTGKLINFDSILEFDLEVLHEIKTDDYIINNHHQLVSKIIISRIIPGNIYQAKVDPNDKNNVCISWL